MKLLTLSLICAVTLLLPTRAHAQAAECADEHGISILGYKMKSIDGKDVPLEKYKGKAVLVVNVASKCGLTPQYEQLEAVYKKYKDEGLVIAAFPANEFMGQEPGSNEEIQAFCKSKFGVTFDLFSKIVVKGDEIHPLYKDLTSKEKNGAFGGEIRWNFDKFLVDRCGHVVGRFDPKTKPDAPEVITSIEKVLGTAKASDDGSGKKSRKDA